jgi:hypothetical protein
MKPSRSPILLQVNFSFDMPAADYVGAVAPLAEAVAAVPGLHWKIWLLDEDNLEAAGIYLFDDATRAQAYLEGPILAPFFTNPAIRDVSVRLFDILDEPTATTRGPVREFIRNAGRLSFSSAFNPRALP